MKRRAAIQSMGVGLASMFLSACADGTKILSPFEGSTTALPGATKQRTRKSRVVVGHTIFVTVEDNSISVVPETLKMTTNDHLRFAATNGRRFSIVFDGAGPFVSRELGFDAASGRLTPRAKGRFKYTVVSEENPNLILDPEVIVGDPPSQPHP